MCAAAADLPHGRDPDTDRTAQRRAEVPLGIAPLLARRSLAQDARRLAEVLRPGQRVLDVGCGTGAITRGIAQRVGLSGSVVGLDSNARLLAEARDAHGDLDNLSFRQARLEDLPFQDEFDVVVAARVLQWLSDPATAVRRLTQMVRPGGLVIVLDYNHLKLEQHPPMPDALAHFHRRYLAWRLDAGMDNEIADHLPALFAAAGLTDVHITPQHEEYCRTDSGFPARIGLKVEVCASRGPQLVAEGWLSESERAEAEAQGRVWMAEVAVSQTLYLLCVEGRRPVLP